MRKDNESAARVEEIDGKPVLIDPAAIGLIKAVAKSNCKVTHDLQIDRIKHFKNRMVELKSDPAEVLIIIANADDVHGSVIANALMKGFNWKEIRDRGEIPFARGLALREPIQEMLALFDPEAAEKLEKTQGVAVVVVDHQVAEIF